MNEEQTSFNIGPQHPALKEPETFRVIVEGERVVKAEAILGHTHRGIEKMAESRDYNKTLYLAERICGICSFAHNANFARAVEFVADVKVPKRAEFLRVLVAELERLHSHLLWLGVLAHEIGFDTFYILVWNDRETIMDLLETLTGNRVNYGMNRIGGVRFDLNDEIKKIMRDKIEEFKPRLEKIRDVVLNSKTIIARTNGVGRISKDLARKTCVTGPTARSSGIDWDLRRDEPYFIYEQLDFNVPISDRGDVYSKIILRVKELFESIKIIEQVLDLIPSGKIFQDVRGRFEGKAVSRIEAPRGENFHYVEFRKSKNPYRLKVRAPTYANVVSSVEALVGHHIADIPVIVAANDPCFSCTDRTLIIDRDKGRYQIMSARDLRKLSVETTKEVMQ